MQNLFNVKPSSKAFVTSDVDKYACFTNMGLTDSIRTSYINIFYVKINL